ncbi:MAG: Glycosyl phosphatidyl inositol anchor synthesis [Bathelium mastoideum]|nr:MAG: Glycosyl phosphatidyl inositol anchor synthesis [Bathelium mastoideum]
MARLGRLGFLAVAVVFHLVYIYSIFDIYFVSPIVHGMREYSVNASEPPAKRLVLFVGDGLRADKAFQFFPDPSPENNNTVDAQKPRPLAPFLRSRVLEYGTFGVSHTRVPTESRPGHVALIAGLYEDVSAVMTGWKLNPVNFDSVFNQSSHTWSWGSPDILPMFKEGAVPGRIDADTYGAEEEDFSKDATELDVWVFEKVKKMFQEARHNTTLDAALRQEKVVFFLHLLGLDTTGHSYRPYSREYLHNIKVVDQGVQEITKLIDDFYGDDKTAYVFTADHGMSDWGSHGDGHPDNTRTPLIAWGSGVATPIKSTNGKAAGHEDGFSQDWGLDHITRHDVDQADVAALMAYLAGLAFPANSVGELPLEYLSANAHDKAEALLVNARELLEMYRVKEEQKRATVLRYKPFSSFATEDRSIERRTEQIRDLIEHRKFDKAIEESKALLKLGIEGLRYLQTYDWLFLRALVTVGYLGWIAFAVTTVVDLHVLHGQTQDSRSTTSTLIFTSALVALYSFLFIQSSPWNYYAYAIFPVVFWEEVWARRSALIKGKEALFGREVSSKQITEISLNTLAFIGLLEALVQSYHIREIYSVCYFVAAAWPAFYGTEFLKQNTVLAGTWAMSCILMSVFTLLPAIKTESLPLILVGGGIVLAIGVLYLLYEKSIISQARHTEEELASAPVDSVSRMVLGGQVGLVALAMFVTRSSVLSLQARSGLPLGAQIVGWLVLVASLTVPFLHGLQPNNHYLHRLMVLFLSFAPIFIILTISYEGLFYFAFFTTLVTWVRLEHRIYSHVNSISANSSTSFSSTTVPSNGVPTNPTSELNPLAPALATAKERLHSLNKKSYRSLSLADARIALFFLFLLQSGFFSTGNIASVSSFSLDAVNRLIPVFDPFSQGALLLFKIMIPFACISANLGILNRRLGVAPSALFMVVMAISDVMTLNFFYMVRDEGSWLDIGTSISHFVIASLLCVFVAGLEFVSEALVSGVEFGDEDRTDGSLDKRAIGEGKNANGKVENRNEKIQEVKDSK